MDDPEIVSTYFPDAMDRSKSDQISGIQSLRMATKQYQQATYDFVLQAIKSSSTLRVACLTYIGKALHLNERRNGIHIDLNVVSTFGFTQNLSYILLRLCDPFILPPYSKMHLVDKNYFANPAHKYIISGLTKNNASEQEAIEYWSKFGSSSDSIPQPNFISDCFYLALGWLHTGFVRNLTYYNQFGKELDEEKKEYNRLQQEHQSKYQGTPQESFSSAMLERFKKSINLKMGAKLTMDMTTNDHPEEKFNSRKKVRK
jgi:ubiquitin conjugation factor E4 B